jgi:hypothetical protein
MNRGKHLRFDECRPTACSLALFGLVALLLAAVSSPADEHAATRGGRV